MNTPIVIAVVGGIVAILGFYGVVSEAPSVAQCQSNTDVTNYGPSSVGNQVVTNETKTNHSCPAGDVGVGFTFLTILGLLVLIGGVSVR